MDLTQAEYETLIETLAITCRRLKHTLACLQGAQHEAAEEVKRLRAENERLRRAASADALSH